jgi:hypothetical protein
LVVWFGLDGDDSVIPVPSPGEISGGGAHVASMGEEGTWGKTIVLVLGSRGIGRQNKGKNGNASFAGGTEADSGEEADSRVRKKRTTKFFFHFILFRSRDRDNR